MKLIEVQNYEEMSKVAAKTIIEQVHTKPNSVLGLATGGTPIGTYQHLIKDFTQNNTSFEKAISVNLDEYIGLEKDNPQSYNYYMKEQLFNHINIPENQTYLPFAKSIDDEEAGRNYEKLIESLGGIDMQILGIGENGHIGFNEPGTSFSSTTGIVKLTDSTREANARYFTKMEDVPTHAISMGISTIMKSRKIVLLVSGVKKAPVLNELFQAAVKEDLPASILKEHPDVTIIADQEALSILKENKGSVYS
ncbi:glucosamine-6-phosphate deaminase [Niallia sp.]|uniref:glucosamine-6-phosphate deaminase n=1 Tax=Niallia sp. TaxID=2837523 RepID=UPI0028A0A732|nr:glucosamine-6-phosphate deaminase [Niallia sp.]